ncbi:hypothetical protein RGQ29_020414 [Quercus rubra]|uniref:S-protein homolog n=1 Tax=Quercus rubra TaxID=3512 RepID=A0AAN7FBC4_QUERU|nr:hypothetical protein RGQ29_020414 [Quercus rubra]
MGTISNKGKGQYNFKKPRGGSFQFSYCRVKRFVRIVNHLNNKPLGYHCKSLFDDLGLRTLQPNQEWEFSFHLSLIIVTEFECHFWYQNFKAHFDVYHAGDIGYQCGGDHCIWTAQKDGFYLYNIKSNLNVKMHDWNL